AEESPEQYAEYLSARGRLAGILFTLGEQGQRDGSLRSDVDLDVFILTMVQNFSLFSFKSSLTRHDTSLSSLLSSDKQLTMMKDIFLRYIEA
ncbi:MAG: TetR/AcrR family transcriptional regulator, partial [Psychrobacillus psychrotolerans]